MDFPPSRIVRPFTQSPSFNWNEYGYDCLEARGVNLSYLQKLVKDEMERAIEGLYWDALLRFSQGVEGYDSEQRMADMIGVDRTTLLRWRKGETKALLKSFLAAMVFVAGDSTLVRCQDLSVAEVIWYANRSAIKKVRIEICKLSAQTPTRDEIFTVRAFLRHKMSLQAMEDEDQMRLVIEDIQWHLIRETPKSASSNTNSIYQAIEEWVDSYSLYRIGVPENRRGPSDDSV